MIFHFVLELPREHTVRSMESRQLIQANSGGRKLFDGPVAYPVAVNRFAAAAFVFRCKAVQTPVRR